MYEPVSLFEVLENEKTFLKNDITSKNELVLILKNSSLDMMAGLMASFMTSNDLDDP